MAYITAKRRAKAAVVHVDGEDKYPIDNKKTARSALRLISKAKPPLTDSQKAAVRSRAAKYGEPESASKKRGKSAS